MTHGKLHLINELNGFDDRLAGTLFPLVRQNICIPQSPSPARYPRPTPNPTALLTDLSEYMSVRINARNLGVVTSKNEFPNFLK